MGDSLEWGGYLHRFRTLFLASPLLFSDHFPSLLHTSSMSSSPINLNDGTIIPPIGFGTGQTNSFSGEAGLTVKGPACTAQNVPISFFPL